MRSARRSRRGYRHLAGRCFPSPLGLNGFGSGAEVVLLCRGFLLNHFLAPHVLILSVGLGQIVESKALCEAKLAGALVVPAYKALRAPLGIRGRPLTPAAEKLLVFDLQGADIPLDLTEIFVDGGHKVRGLTRVQSRGVAASQSM